MKEKPNQKTEEVEKAEVAKDESQNNAYWLDRFGISIGKKKFWGSDKFLSLLAFLISVGTFTTFAYQTYLIQKQQYASVLPYLSIYNGRDSDGFRVMVSNNGIGPAFIQDVVFRYNDSSYQINPIKFAYLAIRPDSSVNFSLSSNTLSKGYAIPDKVALSIIGSNNPETADLLRKLFEEDGAEVEITYSSIYDELWRTSTGSPPKKIE